MLTDEDLKHIEWWATKASDRGVHPGGLMSAETAAELCRVYRAVQSGEWVLVPKEPTRKMVKRGRMEIGGGSTFHQDEREEMAAEIYRAMVAAAPELEKP